MHTLNTGIAFYLFGMLSSIFVWMNPSGTGTLFARILFLVFMISGSILIFLGKVS